jgi:DNA mismatch endonuclease, patch repair protein
MSRIKGRDTQPERLVRSLLHSMGYRFRLHAKRLPGKPDVILPKYRIAILVHGCFWHRHTGCRNCTTPTNNQAFWLEKLQGNAARDRRNLRALRMLGWRPVVVWECELEKMEKLEGRLARLLKKDGR